MVYGVLLGELVELDASESRLVNAMERETQLLGAVTEASRCKASQKEVCHPPRGM